jgi:hypothetical protein
LNALQLSMISLRAKNMMYSMSRGEPIATRRPAASVPSAVNKGRYRHNKNR